MKNGMENNRIASHRHRWISIKNKTAAFAVAILLLSILAAISARRPLGIAVADSRADVGNSVPGGTVYLTQFYKPQRLPNLPPPLPAPEKYASDTAVHFPTARATLQANGLALETNKIGFHVGPGGNATGLKENWWMPLDAAGVPVFLKSVDSGGPLWELQEQMKISGVPHTLVFRRTSPYAGADHWVDPDVPDYNLEPHIAAANHWEYHKKGFPPELDPDLVWFETVNEVDKNRADWLGEFALETAKLAVRDGYKWAAFGWSSGEPEPEHWQTPSMLAFLRYAANHPDQIAVALHEYSYVDDNIARFYPDLVGRFQALFDICDQHGIARPTVLITEWGWTYQNVPDVPEAMEDIAWASWLYAAYPEVKGAAIWYLGPGFGGIANRAQPLIAPVGEYSLHNYFGRTPGWGQINSDLLQP